MRALLIGVALLAIAGSAAANHSVVSASVGGGQACVDVIVVAVHPAPPTCNEVPDAGAGASVEVIFDLDNPTEPSITYELPA